MATTTHAVPAGLAARIDAAERQADAAVAAARGRLQRELERIDSDADLSAGAKRRLTQDARAEARQAGICARVQYDATAKALAVAARREAYGAAPRDPAAPATVRAADDTARTTPRDQALDRLNGAIATGDSELARSLARHHGGHVARRWAEVDAASAALVDLADDLDGRAAADLFRFTA